MTTEHNQDIPSNLVSTWINVEVSSGKTMAEALRELNASCNTNYRQSMIRSWERSELAPGRRVYSYMLKKVLPSILKEYGVKKKDIPNVIGRVIMPEPEKKQS